MRNFIWGVIGGMAGGAVCFTFGFLIVNLIGIPPGAYWGVGLEPWNLPGTVAGATVWLTIIIRRLRQN